MKKWLGMSLATLLAVSCTQNGYKVTYTTDNDSVEKVYLYAQATGELLDRADCKDGVAVIDGEMELPVFAVLIPQQAKTTVKLVVDNEPVEVVNKADVIEVIGSELNEKYRVVVSKIDEIGKKSQELMEKAQTIAMEHGGRLPDSISAELSAKYYELMNEKVAYIKESIEQHKEDLISAGLIAIYNSQLDIKEVEEFLKDYKFSNHPILTKVKEYIQALKRKEVGADFVDFTMNDMEGTPRKLSDYVGKGNYVLVDFWASWCGPCRREMPNVKAAYDQFHPKGFEIVGISLDNDKEAWAKATEQMGITWPQMSDLKGWECEAVDLYGIRGIPATILFGPDGKVVAANLRAEALQKKLEEVYQ